jgi:hypothetical protein
MPNVERPPDPGARGAAPEPPPTRRPPGDRAPEAQPEDRPATFEDVRALRRWILVAGIWAVAATVIALIALIDEDEPPRETDRSAARVARLEQSLGERLDALEERLAGVARSEDVRKLERRVAAAEEDAASAARSARQAAERAGEAESRIDELEGRVEDLESAAPPEEQP